MNLGKLDSRPISGTRRNTRDKTTWRRSSQRYMCAVLFCIGMPACAWAGPDAGATTASASQGGACVPGDRHAISVYEFDDRTAAAQLNLAARLKVSNHAADRANALFLDYAASLHSNSAKGNPRMAQELARAAREANDAAMMGLAFTACHLTGPDLADGDCQAITADAWSRTDNGSASALAGKAIQARGNGNDEALASSLRALADVEEEYRAFVPLASVLESRAFSSLPEASQQLVVMNMWFGMNALSLKPLLINYCSAKEMTVVARKTLCSALSTSLIKSSPLVSDRVEALRILKQSGNFSRQERAQMAGRMASLRKLVRKDLVVDRELTCTALSKRARLALDIIQDGELTGYEKYFRRQEMPSVALP